MADVIGELYSTSDHQTHDKNVSKISVRRQWLPHVTGYNPDPRFGNG
ncbi:hypothetical protein GcM3_122020 [Golovinomyces cichoracearum]|uniref:Uncharacterized protein n=1 Tax=Golovinomyces cichoracearum TaxID=62708 RepID=A0A420I6S0_9PEZI|nr:hypothetical protein GcM3_122020 [Golovinomyces cichoracearum]